MDIVTLWRKHPDTTVVTCTRRGCAFINKLAATAFFEERHKKPLGTAPFDYEANADKYTHGEGPLALKKGNLEPSQTEVFAGMRAFLTRNTSKQDDFVNGMLATVQHYDPRSGCLEVATNTGKRLAAHPITEDLPDGRRITLLPARLGHGATSTGHDVAALQHITLWLDAAGCRAAAYVALSRVAMDEDYLIGGQVSPKHFVPAHT